MRMQVIGFVLAVAWLENVAGFSSHNGLQTLEAMSNLEWQTGSFSKLCETLVQQASAAGSVNYKIPEPFPVTISLKLTNMSEVPEYFQEMNLTQGTCTQVSMEEFSRYDLVNSTIFVVSHFYGSVGGGVISQAISPSALSERVDKVQGIGFYQNIGVDRHQIGFRIRWKALDNVETSSPTLSPSAARKLRFGSLGVLAFFLVFR